jgi:hypothetical protein
MAQEGLLHLALPPANLRRRYGSGGLRLPSRSKVMRCAANQSAVQKDKWWSQVFRAGKLWNKSKSASLTARSAARFAPLVGKSSQAETDWRTLADLH